MYGNFSNMGFTFSLGSSLVMHTKSSSSGEIARARIKHLLDTLPLHLRVLAVCKNAPEQSKALRYWSPNVRKAECTPYPELVTQEELKTKRPHFIPLLAVFLSVSKARDLIDEELADAIPQYIYDYIANGIPDCRLPKLTNRISCPAYMKRRLFPKTKKDKEFVEARRQQENQLSCTS